MRVERLVARNYRTLEDVDVSFIGNYVTISGHNDCGKSNLIRLLTFPFRREIPWRKDLSIDYLMDKTKWAKEGTPIEIEYVIRFVKAEDAEMFDVVGLSGLSTPVDRLGDELVISLTLEVLQDKPINARISVSGEEMSDAAVRNFRSRLRSADNLYLHNSAANDVEFFYNAGRPQAYYDLTISDQDREEVEKARRGLQSKIRKVGQQHKAGLDEMLAVLSDRYKVEFATYEPDSLNEFPIEINLADRNVEAPLISWGSGTQNKLHILISLLKAKRAKEKALTTPIVVIEEPESFLHPKAQAEFGRVLRELADAHQLQVIVATHSPYMLNQARPESNLLFKRKTH